MTNAVNQILTKTFHHSFDDFSVQNELEFIGSRLFGDDWLDRMVIFLNEVTDHVVTKDMLLDWFHLGVFPDWAKDGLRAELLNKLKAAIEISRIYDNYNIALEKEVEDFLWFNQSKFSSSTQIYCKLEVKPNQYGYSSYQPYIILVNKDETNSIDLNQWHLVDCDFKKLEDVLFIRTAIRAKLARPVPQLKSL